MKRVVDKKCTKILNEVKKDLKGVINFSSNIDKNVYICNTKCSLGHCIRNINDYSYTIYVSKYLLNCSDKLIRNVLAHELIHTIPNCFAHNNEFIKNMLYINKYYGFNIEIRNTDKEFKKQLENKNNYKYKIRCPKCGVVFYRNRLPKDRWLLQHATDGGLLEVTQLY
jgi:hypothetical protein